MRINIKIRSFIVTVLAVIFLFSSAFLLFLNKGFVFAADDGFIPDLPSEMGAKVGDVIIDPVDSNKTYQNYECGYGVNDNGIYNVVANFHAAVELGSLTFQPLQDSVLTAKAGETIDSAANTYLLRYFTSVDDFKAKYKARYLDIFKGYEVQNVYTYPAFNPGAAQSKVEMWGGVLKQDFILGDSEFMDWGNNIYKGRARLSSLVFNPAINDFVLIADYVKVWDDQRTKTSAIGLPLYNMMMQKTIGGKAYEKIQIFDTGYIYTEGGISTVVSNREYNPVSNTFEKYIGLTPVRASEFGKKVGAFFIRDKKVYQNYERGYVVADYDEAEETVFNKKDVASKNVDSASGAVSAIPVDKMLEIVGLNVSSEVATYWGMASETPYNQATLVAKFKQKYSEVYPSYNLGVASTQIDVWDGSVIKQEYFDGDGKYGYDTVRTNVTVLAYSFLKDSVFAIKDEFFNQYKSGKAAALGEPIGNERTDIVINGKSGVIQIFERGYIFKDQNSQMSVRTGVVFNEETNEFETGYVSEARIKKTTITQDQLAKHPVYGGITMAEVQTAFYQKYTEIASETFNPGFPNNESISFWDGSVIKQEYVGGDGVGNAWGRTSLMMILNPKDKTVYVVYDIIINVVDKSGMGLGSGEKLGYPLGDQKTVTDNQNTTSVYQEFSQGTIFCLGEDKNKIKFYQGKTVQWIVDALNGNNQGGGEEEKPPVIPEVIRPESIPSSDSADVFSLTMIIVSSVVGAGAIGTFLFFYVSNKKKIKNK